MYYIGIDLGGTVIKIGLVRQGEVIACQTLEANSKQGLQPKLEMIAEVTNALLSDASVTSKELGGIAMAFPGIVDVNRKQVISTNAKYDDAHLADLPTWCLNHWGVPFAIDNDARMATVGEWKYGAARSKTNVVMMTIGTGIGTGVIIDNQLLYGKHYMAGSLGGHLIADYHGRQCSCGNVGCIEALSSSFFLPQIIGENKRLNASFRSDASNFNFKALFTQAAARVADAQTVVKECMNVWSAGIVNYIHAYDPQTVIIGGGIMKSKEIILPYVRKRVQSLAWCPFEEVEIVASELGDHAALLAAEYYFN